MRKVTDHVEQSCTRSPSRSLWLASSVASAAHKTSTSAFVQGQTMNSSDITSAMDFNCKLMEVQIQLVEALTALQVSQQHCVSNSHVPFTNTLCDTAQSQSFRTPVLAPSVFKL